MYFPEISKSITNVMSRYGVNAFYCTTSHGITLKRILIFKQITEADLLSVILNQNHMKASPL